MPANDDLRSPEQINELRDNHREIVGTGGRYIGGAVDRREEAFGRVRSNITSNPRETLDNIKGKDDRSILGLLRDGLLGSRDKDP